MQLLFNKTQQLYRLLQDQNPKIQKGEMKTETWGEDEEDEDMEDVQQ